MSKLKLDKIIFLCLDFDTDINFDITDLEKYAEYISIALGGIILLVSLYKS